MDFSPQQDDALKAVARWLKAGRPQIFRLFGYAGTGKTTLARYFAEHVDGQVQFAAFTGKAASVMRGKGCSGASTIHSLIYRARESGEEIPSFDLWDEAPASEAELIIIDECSMVDAELGRDLLSFGVPVLVLGDPAHEHEGVVVHRPLEVGDPLLERAVEGEAAHLALEEDVEGTLAGLGPGRHVGSPQLVTRPR